MNPVFRCLVFGTPLNIFPEQKPSQYVHALKYSMCTYCFLTYPNLTLCSSLKQANGANATHTQLANGAIVSSEVFVHTYPPTAKFIANTYF